MSELADKVVERSKLVNTVRSVMREPIRESRDLSPAPNCGSFHDSVAIPVILRKGQSTVKIAMNDLKAVSLPPD